MATETTTTAADLMRQYREPLAYQIMKKTLVLDNVKKNTDEKRWDGSFVEIPLIFNAFLQGATALTEEGTLGDADVEDTGKARVETGSIGIPIKLTRRLRQQLKKAANQEDDPRGAYAPVKDKMKRAAQALQMLAEEASVGDGTGVIATIDVDDTTTDTVHVTDCNWYLIYRGRKVDVRNKSTGALNADGSAVKIIDYDKEAETITFSTSLTAVDGTTTGQEAIFIVNSGTGKNPLPMGVMGPFGGGEFQGIDPTDPGKGDWQGQVYDNGGTLRDPKKSVFDQIEREQERICGTAPEFYFGDAAVVDGYGDIYMDKVRWTTPTAKLTTGWSGYGYKDKAIIPVLDMPANKLVGPTFKDARIYTLDESGPDWDDDTGSIWQRFERKPVVEAWMLWDYQLGYSRLASQALVEDLNQGPLED